MLSGLYAITDDTLLPESRLKDAVEQTLLAGCRLVQYRSKIEDRAFRLRQAQQLQALCEHHDAQLIINDDADLCREVNASGVHLGKGDSPIRNARETLGPNKIIGVTCHDSVDAAVEAEQASANYVAFGRFFPSQTKPGASPAPLEVLTEAKNRLRIPIVAIGGINAENGAALINAGADMLAVINAIFADYNVAESTTRLINLFNSSNN